MSYVDTLRTANAILLAQAEKALDQVARNGPTAIRAAADLAAGGNRIRRVALELGVRAAIAALTEAIELAREQLEILKHLNELGGSPDRLRLAASTLRAMVAAPLDSIEPAVRRDSLEAMVPSAWHDGDAHTTYHDGFDGQHEAARDAADAARAIARSLESMADGISDFYLELSIEILAFCGAVVAFVAGMATLVAEGVGVLGVIAGIVSALGASGALVLTASRSRGTPIGDDVPTLTWPAAKFADL